MKKNNKKFFAPKNEPSFWISILRLIACCLIFLHHYLKIIAVISSYSTSAVIAIGFFLFISGYLIPKTKSPPKKWLKARIIKIYIPFWLILIPLFAINFFLKGREFRFIFLLIEFLGGTLFMRDPLYEAPWFLTFILGLYLISYIIKKINYKFKIFELSSLAFLLIIYYIIIISLPRLLYITSNKLIFWLATFFLGYLISYLNIPKKILLLLKNKSVIINPEINKIIFNLSKYSYPFYLVHGPALFLLFNHIKLHEESTFIFGILFSTLLSIAIEKAANFINQLPSLSIHWYNKKTIRIEEI